MPDTLLEDIARSLCKQSAKYQNRPQIEWQSIASPERSFWRQMARTALVRIIGELYKLAEVSPPESGVPPAAKSPRITPFKTHRAGS